MSEGGFVRENFARISARLSSRFRGSTRRTYDQVNDVHDTRIPLYNEEAFRYGILFKAKFIGSLEINRPSNKLDIITAMRRIRYEFKVKGIKKARCHLYMSLDGVKITKRKKNRRRKHYTDDQLFIMQHQIYRIFYVSHDSQDQRIFSYITRETPTNTFRCNVFKAKKKSLALHIVRTLGQAFDVCHKLNPRPVVPKEKKEGEGAEESKDEKEVPETDIDAEGGSEVGQELKTSVQMTDLDAIVEKSKQDGEKPLIQFPVTFDDEGENYNWASGLGGGKANGKLSSDQKLVTSNPFSAGDQDAVSDSQQLYGHIEILQKQLWEETSARIEAQGKVDHLLKQNKELMDHLQKLLGQSQPSAGDTADKGLVTTPPPVSSPESAQAQTDLMAHSFVSALSSNPVPEVEGLTVSDTSFDPFAPNPSRETAVN